MNVPKRMNDTTRITTRQPGLPPPTRGYTEPDAVLAGQVWVRVCDCHHARIEAVSKDRRFVWLQSIGVNQIPVGDPRTVPMVELQPTWQRSGGGNRGNGEVYQIQRDDPNAAGTRETAQITVDTAGFGLVPVWTHRPASTVVAVLPFFGNSTTRVGNVVRWDQSGRIVNDFTADDGIVGRGKVEEITPAGLLIVRQLDPAAREVVP